MKFLSTLARLSHILVYTISLTQPYQKGEKLELEHFNWKLLKNFKSKVTENISICFYENHFSQRKISTKSKSNKIPLIEYKRKTKWKCPQCGNRNENMATRERLVLQSQFRGNAQYLTLVAVKM